MTATRRIGEKISRVGKIGATFRVVRPEMDVLVEEER